MPAEIFLIVPDDVDPASFPDALQAVLTGTTCPALLLQRGGLSENAYKSLAKAIIPVAQQAGTAVLVEGEPGLVRLLGADGLHVSGSAAAVREAVEVLKPDLIVGAAGIGSRHDAMTKGELEVDYVFFGSPGGTQAEDREIAAWWAQTMEVPAVLCEPGAEPEAVDPLGCEFIALGRNIWDNAAGPGQALSAAARRLESL